MEDETLFTPINAMSSLLFHLSTLPLEQVNTNLNNFVSDRAPKDRSSTQAYYILHDGLQYFDRSEAARFGAWEEKELKISPTELQEFLVLLENLEKIVKNNRKLQNAVRTLLRRCNNEFSVYCHTPSCVHKYLPYDKPDQGIEEIPSPEADIIKQRIVELMILFPNL